MTIWEVLRLTLLSCYFIELFELVIFCLCCDYLQLANIKNLDGRLGRHWYVSASVGMPLPREIASNIRRRCIDLYE